MSEQENIFLLKIDKLFRNQRTLYLSIIIPLVILVLAIVFGVVSVSASNRTSIQNITGRINVIDKDYVDINTFDRLVKTFELQYELLFKLDRKEFKTADEARIWFEDLRKEMRFDIKTPTRGNDGNKK